MKKGVYLIGAGPGDKKLMTIKGSEILKNCDVVVYDQLANPSLLNETKAECVKIYVGKKSGDHTMKQEDINNLLVSLSRDYPIVVRLKGGDPYVFGRGSEEGEVLFDHGVYFEVVPGITSAIGGLAYAGIPATARNIASSFHVITGHISKTSNPIDFDALARLDGTLIFLMGVANLEKIVTKLMKYGKDCKTPVAVIHKASRPEQKVYIGTLETIYDIGQKEDIKPPSLIVVGDVVNLREKLQFVEKLPLAGKKVLVTRSRKKQSKFANKLEAVGADVVLMPTISCVPQQVDELKVEIANIKERDGIIFTSSVAVDLFFASLKDMKKDTRVLAGLHIVAIGKETASVLTGYGILADDLPVRFTKEGIIDLFNDTHDHNKSYLLPRSAKGDSKWLDKMGEHISLKVVDCYDTVTDESILLDYSAVQEADYITFTSSSTVHGFARLLEREGLSMESIFKNKKAVAIGPITGETLETYNINPDLIPDEYTIQGMVDVMVDHINGGK